MAKRSNFIIRPSFFSENGDISLTVNFFGYDSTGKVFFSKFADACEFGGITIPINYHEIHKFLLKEITNKFASKTNIENEAFKFLINSIFYNILIQEFGTKNLLFVENLGYIISILPNQNNIDKFSFNNIISKLIKKEYFENFYNLKDIESDPKVHIDDDGSIVLFPDIRPSSHESFMNFVSNNF